jgi:hypothetical protein
MATVDEREVWEQQDNEPPTAFEDFLIFLKMERTERSIRGAYRRKNNVPDEQAGTINYPGMWFTRAQQFQWVERAKAYDRMLDRKSLARLEHRRLKSLEEIADMGETLRRKAVQAARMLTAVQQTVGHDAQGREIVLLEVKMTPGEIARMAQVGAELEQLAVGNPTSRVSMGEDKNAPFAVSLDSAKEALVQRLLDVKKRREEAERDVEIGPDDLDPPANGPGTNWKPTRGPVS